MTPINLPNLKRLCAEATSQYFHTDIRSLKTNPIDADKPTIDVCGGSPDSVSQYRVANALLPNANYIAAANPATVAQLIECVEIMRSKMNEIVWSCENDFGRSVHTLSKEALSEVAKRVGVEK